MKYLSVITLILATLLLSGCGPMALVGAVGQTVNNANDLSLLILEKAYVATVPGDAFGYPNCIRISYSASREQIEEAIRRIKDLLS